MQSSTDLQQLLRSIDHKSYPAYKSLKGTYRVPAYKFVGTMAVILSGCMVLVYCIPGSGGTLIMQEWMMVGAWSLLGIVFFAVCKLKYKEKFGSLIEIISDEDAASLMPEADDKELDLVIDAAIDRVLSRMPA